MRTIFCQLQNYRFHVSHVKMAQYKGPNIDPCAMLLTIFIQSLNIDPVSMLCIRSDALYIGLVFANFKLLGKIQILMLYLHMSDGFKDKIKLSKTMNLKFTKRSCF